MKYDKLLRLGAELGRQLLNSGAEIYRVEESVTRLLTAYGLDPQVFAIPNCLIVSITSDSGESLTRMCRIGAHGTDIELLERCNALCRRLCAELPPVEDALALVEHLNDGLRRFSPRTVLCGYVTAAAFFALFFGGGLREALAAALCGLAAGGCMLYGHKLTGSNIFFRTAVCAAVISASSLLLRQLGLSQNVDIVSIGTLMVLVPGMALTNAMREIMAGDITSGLHRTAEVLLVATAIAIGTAVPLILSGPFSADHAAPVVMSTYFLPCLCAFCACVGFGLVFNIQGRGILICGFGAGLGWLVYLIGLHFGVNDIFSAFVAAMVISSYSELMARVRRCPVTGYLQVALLPLVPGAGIYRAMRYCISGETSLFLSTLLHTLGFAAALSIGAMLITSILRTVLPYFRSRKA